MTRTHLFGLLLATLLVHAVIMFAPIIYPLYGDQSALGDVAVFYRHASAMWSGAVPYRDYVVEYPPVALPLFLLPRMLTGLFGLYVVLFVVEMLVWDAIALYFVIQWSAKRSAHVPVALGWYTLFLAALYPFTGVRYDLAPAAVAFAAAVLWFSGRRRFGGSIAAVGTFIKVFPACIACAGFIWEAKQLETSRLRGTFAFTALLVLGGATWSMFGASSTLAYHTGLLEIETLWAGLIMAIGTVTGGRLPIAYVHGSDALHAPSIERFASFLFPIQGLTLLSVLWFMWRTKSPDPLRYAGAVILALLVTGARLSPQYLVWLIPFVAVLEGSRSWWTKWVFLITSVLTTSIYPWEYTHLVALEPWAIALLNSRNALLIGLLVAWLFDVPRTTSAKPSSLAAHPMPAPSDR